MYKRMKFICCDVLFRMACRAAAHTKNIIDLDFTRLQSHNEPDLLRKEIQGLIDKADAEGVYESILLGYGLCGNSTAGLVARGQPLVIPRAHDCCTLFLGSRANFKDKFGDRLSAQWSSHGYLERNHDYAGGTDINKSLGLDKDYAALVEQYGEDNAEYIWETLHPAYHVGKGERLYIDVAPFDCPGGSDEEDFHYKRYERAVIADMKTAAAPDALQSGSSSMPDASQTGATNPDAAHASDGFDPGIQRIGGSARLIDMLLDGEWGDDFLIVPPGMAIAAVYDMEQVVTSLRSGT